MEPREAIITVTITVFAGCLLLTIPASLVFRRFLAEVPQIETESDLDRFKRLAARDMYAALALLLAVAFVGVLVVWGLARGIIGMGDFALLLTSGTPFLITGGYLKRLEGKVQCVPTTDESLREERDRVVQTWMNKPFPDW